MSLKILTDEGWETQATTNITGGGGGSPVNMPYATDWVNEYTASGTTVTASVQGVAGDYLILAVMNRAELTIPNGWTVLVASGEYPGFTQWSYILGKEVETTGTQSVTVTQASADRLSLQLLNFTGVTKATGRSDLTIVDDDGPPYTVSGKDTSNLVVWVLAIRAWNTSGGPAYPYAFPQTVPWQSVPLMASPTIWNGSGNSGQRLGVFLDYAKDGSRSFSPGRYTTSTDFSILAVELE